MTTTTKSYTQQATGAAADHFRKYAGRQVKLLTHDIEFRGHVVFEDEKFLDVLGVRNIPVKRGKKTQYRLTSVVLRFPKDRIVNLRHLSSHQVPGSRPDRNWSHAYAWA